MIQYVQVEESIDRLQIELLVTATQMAGVWAKAECSITEFLRADTISEQIRW